MAKIYLTGIFIILIVSPYFNVSADNPNFVVSGNLINETSNDSILGIKVSLHVDSLDTSTEIYTNITDDDGKFLFEDIAFSDKSIYGLSVEYSDTVYVTSVNAIGEDIFDIELKVYETTNDNSIISINNASILLTQVDGTKKTLSILEIVTISNDSKLTYIPGSGPMDLLRFGLPPKAQHLIVDTDIAGADYLQVDKGFALIASVPPGIHDLMYTYDVYYENAIFEYVKTWRYGAGNLRLVIPEGQIMLGSDFDIPVRPAEIGGRIYNVQEIKGISREHKSKIRLSNLPLPTFLEKTFKTFGDTKYEYLGPVGLLLFLFIIGSFGIYNTLKLRQRSDSWFPGSSEKQVLKDLISELEIKFQKRLISSKYYEKTKADLYHRKSYLPED